MNYLTESERDEITRIADGRSVVANCILGLGVKLDESDTGKLIISVAEAPLGAGDPVCAALRTMMEEIAVSWLKIVAPHRLSYGSDDR